jgi:hypothetical protein
MTAEELFRVDPLSAYEWPCTFRYHTETSWGRSQLEITVDAPALAGDIEHSMNLGHVLWSRAIAPAIVHGVSLLAWDTVMWQFQPSALPMVDGLSTGLLAGSPAAREDSAVAVLHSGHSDDLGRRRMILPGVPSTWVSGGLLTLGARDALEAWGEMMLMGLCRSLTGAPLQWLLTYPGLLPASSENVGGVAFRKVEYVRGCHHTRRAPDPTSAPWP